MDIEIRWCGCKSTCANEDRGRSKPNPDGACEADGRQSEYLVPSLVPETYTCGPGLCSIVGLPDQASFRVVKRSYWKDWREYK